MQSELQHGLPDRAAAPAARPIRVFTGTFLCRLEMLGMELTTITIVRDPVERTISYLRHCKRHHDQHRDLAGGDLRRPVLLPVLHPQPRGEAVRVHGRGPPETYMDVLDDRHRRARAREGEPRAGRRRGPAGALRRTARRAARAVRLAVTGCRSPRESSRRRRSRPGSGDGSPPTTRPTSRSTSTPQLWEQRR